MADKDINLELRLDVEGAKAKLLAATYSAVAEVFEIDIKAAAKDASPVDTGNNKRSIDTEVTVQDGQVVAELFTQSGYGGYLEVGTYKMEARPYLGPAFDEGVATIPAKIKEKLR